MKKILLSGVALALLLVACGEEEVTLPPPPPPPNPIKEILIWVEAAFNQTNTTYLELTLSEDFVFYFDPDDVGRTPPGSNYVIPESWDYTEFWQAVGNLFEKAYTIALTIPAGGVGEPGPNQTTYKVENINIRLLVMPDEEKVYLADHGYCDFRFERSENEGGKASWRLTEWWDNTAATPENRLARASPSLGRLLAVYY